MGFVVFTQGQSSEVRQAAGLMLKNNLKSSYQSMPLAYQQYIKAELRPCLGASDKQVRATVAIVVSALVQQGNGQDWPEIFQAFVQCLDSNDYNHMEGALDSLSKVRVLSPFIVIVLLEIFLLLLLEVSSCGFISIDLAMYFLASPSSSLPDSRSLGNHRDGSLKRMSV
jgi:hypothetical protein